MSSAKLIIATHNRGKLAELRTLLARQVEGLEPSAIISAAEFDLPDVKEDGVTFAQNALLKARAVAAATGIAAVADDSGLSVDVLGGAPGIFSARWAGEHGNDPANNALLLAQLGDIAAEHRGAQFVCAAALVTPDGFEHVREGVLEGELLTAPRGEGGFGYDPLFLPRGESRSTAEMSADEKNAISHRARAFAALAPVIAQRVEF